MNYQFDVCNQSRFSNSKLFNKNTLENTKKLMTRLKFPNESVIEINFVTNNKIQKLNQQYLNKNFATDVLSFANPTNISKIPFVGTIFICPVFLKKKGVKKLHFEIKHLIFHGLMHLAGKTHEKKKDLAIWDKLYKNLNI